MRRFYTPLQCVETMFTGRLQPHLSFAALFFKYLYLPLLAFVVICLVIIGEWHPLSHGFSKTSKIFDVRPPPPWSNFLYYRPQRSCGKVIFSQACVKNAVGGGGGRVWQGMPCMVKGWGMVRGVCVAGGVHGRGHVWQGGMCGWGHVWWGACVVGGMCGGGHVWWGACVVGGGGVHGGGVHGRGHAW